jgi:tRNA(adenine34) deaminase
MSISDADYQWMEKAIAQAKLAGEDVPVGSVLVRGNELLAEAHNQKEATQDPTDHAEISVIRKATAKLKNWRLHDATLYTTLEPCAMCAEAIIQCRITRLVFGAFDPKSGAVGSAFNLYVIGRIYPLPEVVGGVREEECQMLLRQFFKQRRAEVETGKL